MFLVSSCANVKRWSGDLRMHPALKNVVVPPGECSLHGSQRRAPPISVRWPGVARASRLQTGQIPICTAFNLSSLSHQGHTRLQDHGPIEKVDNFAVPFVWLGTPPNFSMTFPSPLYEKNCMLYFVCHGSLPSPLPLKIFQGATFTPQAAKMKNLLHLHFYLAGSKGILAGFLNASCNRGMSRRINHDQ